MRFLFVAASLEEYNLDRFFHQTHPSDVLPTLATNQVVRMLCVSEQGRRLQDELEDLADFASIALPRPGAAWELAPLGLY